MAGQLIYKASYYASHAKKFTILWRAFGLQVRWNYALGIPFVKCIAVENGTGKGRRELIRSLTTSPPHQVEAY